MTKFKEDLQLTKRSKWLRDQSDYEGGFVYPWNSDRIQNNNRRFKQREMKGDGKTNVNNPAFLDKDKRGVTEHLQRRPAEAEGDGDNNSGRTRRQKTKTQEPHSMVVRSKTTAPPW